MAGVIEFSNVDFAYPEEDTCVFTNMSVSLPAGITSIIGQNGTGKSTLLLLGGGRLFPQQGAIEILKTDSRRLTSEQERNEYVSFIYQNMEFETEDSVEELMVFIYQNGFHLEKSGTFVDELIEVFELTDSKGTQFQFLSKGEMQRSILAFSLLYGSKIIMMDEPIFALEGYQKKRAMEYMTGYARSHSVHLLYSVHEIEIAENYSDNTVLFYKNGSIKTGSTKEILSDGNIEDAYGLPRPMLHQKEHLYRENLMRLSTVRPNAEIEGEISAN